MYLSSGRGRKSGGARATGATPSLAPLLITQGKVKKCNAWQTYFKAVGIRLSMFLTAAVIK